MDWHFSRDHLFLYEKTINSGIFLELAGSADVCYPSTFPMRAKLRDSEITQLYLRIEHKSSRTEGSTDSAGVGATYPSYEGEIARIGNTYSTVY